MDWPKCEVCEGEGKIYDTDSGDNTLVECHVCNGTGERDLTADEADGYLRGCGYQYTRTKTGGLLVRKGDGSHTFAIDDEQAITRALNSACRAVRSKG